MEPPPGFVPVFGENESRIESPPWLPAGWHAVERPRDTSAHADRFYYTPDCGVRLRSKPEVERYLAGKPTLESLAKGAPRPPPMPPACPVEEVTALARDLLAQNRAKAASRPGAPRGAAGAGSAAGGAAAASGGSGGPEAGPSAPDAPPRAAADGDTGLAAARAGPATAAPSAAAGAAAAPQRAPPPLAPAPKARGAKRRMESELEALGRQLCVRGVLLSAARLRRNTHLPLLKALPALPLATPLADALDPWPVQATPAAGAAAAGRDD